MKPKDVIGMIQALAAAHKIKTEVVKGATIYVAENDGLMARVVALHVLYLIISRLQEGKIRWDLARAPSMVKAWRELALLWRLYLPKEKGNNICLAPFDEIRGEQYKLLELAELRANLPKGVFPNEINIYAGNCSAKHAAAEAARLNKAIREWMEEDVFAFAVAGLSPNADLETVLRGVSGLYHDFECHIAFDRDRGMSLVTRPYKAIAMSEAGSSQQAREKVVDSTTKLLKDHVVTMTGWHIANHTDAMLLCLPNDRGLNLFRALHDEPQTRSGGLPAALIQKHPGLGRSFPDGVLKVVICTTEQSWLQFQCARKHHEETGEFLGV